ncbi:unnamed protein product [Symbiodinium pilosum]|uniref:Uncharacterized protein n=1 Tax=Symbiodinium pilosum TaxID=2952 RepID=A0A812VIQ5_SYMPI|nr:unnamed protein product [Symbiodinium pilosum]
MGMPLRTVLISVVLTLAAAEDSYQEPATAPEALPQTFWDSFVYCKCGLSCAERDGSIGKACGCQTCVESNTTSLRGSQPSATVEVKGTAMPMEAPKPEQKEQTETGKSVALEKSLGYGWNLPSTSPVSCPCGKRCAKGRILGLWNYWCFRYECRPC